MWRSRFSFSLIAQSNLPLYGLLALALFIGFFYQLGAVPLFDLDEGAFGQSRRRRVRSSHSRDVSAR